MDFFSLHKECRQKKKNLFIQQSRIYRKTCLLPCVYAAIKGGNMETTFLHDTCCPQATQSLETIEIIMGLAAEGVYAAAESGGVQDIEKGGTSYARLGELIGTAHIEQNGIGIRTECLTEVKGIELVGFCTAHTGGKQGNERKGKEFLWFHLLAVG